MDNVLKIKSVQVDANKVKVLYEKSGGWVDYLVGGEFFAEYDCGVEGAPISIAVIPFLVNVLPIAWVFDLRIELGEVDRTFFQAIPEMIKGYQAMYPSLKFANNVFARTLVENKAKNNKKSAVLFSGGVDAYCTLLRHYEEKPDIITIFGADIRLDDNDGITTVSKLNKEIAEELGINFLSVRTNFREMINYHNLYKKMVDMKIRGEWWHEFQHGIGIIGLVAPLSWANGYNVVYIASSYCEAQKGKYTCASDPMIDNMLKYGGTHTVHDGYELTRQDKVRFICAKRKEIGLNQIKLRVCWESSGGKNCCHCEKCYRTIMALLAEKEDPNRYYFDLDAKKRNKMMVFLKKYLRYDIKNINKALYIPIQDEFKVNYNGDSVPLDLVWFLTIKIGEKDPKYYLLRKRIKDKVKRMIRSGRAA